MFGVHQTDGNQSAVRKVSACPNPYSWHVAESDVFLPSVFTSLFEIRNSTSIHKMYKPMNTLSKLTACPFQRLAIWLDLTKASTIIPVTKQSHIISGLRSLFFIRITLISSGENQTSPDDRAAERREQTLERQGTTRPWTSENATACVPRGCLSASKRWLGDSQFQLSQILSPA